MRMPIIAANWKMNMTNVEAVYFSEKIKVLADDSEGVKIIICPPYTALSDMQVVLSGSDIKLGAQNMHYEAKGAFTGEISAQMLRPLCDYVLVGHSDRRHIFHETDEVFNKKVIAALENGLMPILCVGEILEEREAGRTAEVVRRQLKDGLAGLGAVHMAKVILAYEPVWAISRGNAAQKSATSQDAQDVHALIRGELLRMFGKDTAQRVRILYGGSMKPENATELLSMPDIDGGLIGNASLEPDKFFAIIKACKTAKVS